MIFWDSSALVALLVDEPDSRRRLKQLQEDRVMTVWWSTPVECESALQRRVRAGALTRAQARTAQQRLARLAEAWHEVAPTPAVRKLAVRLLLTHPLRADDALQLAAALALAGTGLEDIRFACADARLNEAAEIEQLTLMQT